MRSLFFQAFLVQTIVRLFIIRQYPYNFAFDGFQRWAGREHLLVRDWMPATQSFIYLCDSLGIGIIGTKIVLSLLGSLAVASTSLIVAHLYDRRAGQVFIALSFFSPFVTWSGTLYQEGTFLALSMSALALVLHLPKNKLWLADLVAGSVALSRYEGWPFVILYIIWRRDLKAGLALWGMGTWIAIKLTGMPSFDPSPINYADWEGMKTRFSWTEYFSDCLSYFRKGFLYGAMWIWIGALFTIKKAFQKDPWLTVLLLLLLGSQCAAVLGWIAGLETVILRMLIIPAFLLSIFCAGLSRKWNLLYIFLIGFVLFGLQQTRRQSKRNSREFRFERKLTRYIEECSDCQILVFPRKGMGTRDRHDGCEILQGISTLVHPQDFTCGSWEESIDETLFTHQAEWTDRSTGYEVTLISDEIIEAIIDEGAPKSP
jgi:hypothetical protein